MMTAEPLAAPWRGEKMVSAGASAQGSLLVGGDVTTPGVLSPGGVPGQRRMVWMPRKLLSVPGVAQLASCAWAAGMASNAVIRIARSFFIGASELARSWPLGR